MLQLIYNDKSYMDILHKFAKLVHGTVVNNKLVFPPEFADGYAEVVILSNGLQVFLSQYTIHQDFLLMREKTREEFYTLRFEEFVIKDNLTFRIDGETLTDQERQRAAAILTSSLFDVAYFGTCGGSTCSVNILIDKEWMARYLGIDSQDEVLRYYLSLKTASFNMEPMDAEYRELFTEVFDSSREGSHNISSIRLQNRIMLLVERFFTRLYSKIPEAKKRTNLKNDDIQRIMDAEALLVSDFSVPAPTIAELSRHSAMSETKFKKEFKKIYQTGPYEYFQKNRMQRARMLLMSGRYSVKETGLQLGYNNLSNFTIAFKKEFGLLPSEV
jgi:AraC-like DNA-binding protein